MNARILTTSLVAVVLATAAFTSSANAGGCSTRGGYGGGYNGHRQSSHGHRDYGHGGYGRGYAECDYNYHGCSLPALGFRSTFVHCLGERVTYVHCHSIAECMGLRRGDVILMFNGCPLNCRNDWYSAYYGALCGGGHIELTVRRHCGTVECLHYDLPGYAAPHGPAVAGGPGTSMAPVVVPVAGGPAPAGLPGQVGPVVPAAIPAGLPQAGPQGGAVPVAPQGPVAPQIPAQPQGQVLPQGQPQGAQPAGEFGPVTPVEPQGQVLPQPQAAPAPAPQPETAAPVMPVEQTEISTAKPTRNVISKG